MPMMTTGLDNRFPAGDATPCTVFAAELATEPIVLPAVLATVLIDPVTFQQAVLVLQVFLWQCFPQCR